MSLDRLRTFVADLAQLVEGKADEAHLLARGGALLERLVAVDDWLPASFAEPDPACYRQYLLHCDARERFSVVSFVWGPGQATPIHDHTVWGLVGVLRGAELSLGYRRGEDDALRPAGPARRLKPGEVEALSPAAGDVHRVENAYPDRTSVSIHVYGANIGAVARSTFDEAGRPRRFVSGYSNTVLPNLWDRSSELLSA